MAHEYKRKLDDDDIVKLVDDNVRTSTGYTASDLSKEREKVLEYYNAKCPSRHMPGTASMCPRMFITPYSHVCSTARNICSRQPNRKICATRP